MPAHGCCTLYMWLAVLITPSTAAAVQCKKEQSERERNEVEKGEREKVQATACRNAKQLQIYASIIFDEFI